MFDFDLQSCFTFQKVFNQAISIILHFVDLMQIRSSFGEVVLRGGLSLDILGIFSYPSPERLETNDQVLVPKMSSRQTLAAMLPLFYLYSIFDLNSSCFLASS